MESNKIKVLVIDDEVNCYKLTLKDAIEDIKVDFAATIGEAKAQVVTNHYDLAFLDINLGGYNGVDLIPFLQEQGLNISLFTSEFNTPNILKAEKLWVEDKLSKPFLLEEFEEIVRRICGRPPRFKEKSSIKTKVAEIVQLEPDQCTVAIQKTSVRRHQYDYLSYIERYGSRTRSKNVLQSHRSVTDLLVQFKKTDPSLRFNLLLDWSKSELRDLQRYRLAAIEWLHQSGYIDASIESRLMTKNVTPAPKTVNVTPPSILKIGTQSAARTIKASK